MSATHVVALDFTFGDYQAVLREMLPSEVELSFLSADSPGLDAALEQADILLNGWSRVPKELLERAPKLRLVQTTAVGINHIDMAAATEQGIQVANGATTNAVAVAEHTMLLILAVYRRLIASHRGVLQGRWPQSELYDRGVFELSGKTVGLIGFGDIGQTVARLLTGFGTRTLYYRRSRLPVAQETALHATYATLDQLLATSDIVSLHVPLAPDTYHLLGRRELKLMRSSAIVVNVARGNVVDEAELIAALTDGRLAGAGLDVMEQEPLPAQHPFLSMDNVVLTPHLGGASREAVRRVIALACENIRRVTLGQPPMNVVNP
jgi:phosphoglycerate dehydrogenase-like enzyme